ncbi:MAG: methylenetetrahydrofolate reductase [Singulisphaera sp.]
MRPGRDQGADPRGDHADHDEAGDDADGRSGPRCGFPARLLRDVERCGDNAEAVANVGIHWATEQCGDLLDQNVRGIHFYTLNKSDATRRIYTNLGVEDSLALRAR